jgi:hypothetical protein
MVSPVEIAFCLSLIARGVETVERVRQLISVSRSEEARLREFLDPLEVARALAARREFLAEFELLIKPKGETRGKSKANGNARGRAEAAAGTRNNPDERLARPNAREQQTVLARCRRVAIG